MGEGHCYSTDGLEGIKVMPDFNIIKSPIPAGLSVVEASAGTGKTYALSHLVPRLLLDGTMKSVGEILLVTFTNDATRELSARVRQVLETLYAPPMPQEDVTLQGLRGLRSGKDLRKIMGTALREIDQLRVSTIHSFCQQVLQTEGVLCGLPVMPELVPDSRETIETTLRRIWERDIGSSFQWAQMGGDFFKNLKMISGFLAEDQWEFIPPVEATSFQNFSLGTIDPQAVDELHEILKSVTNWNKAAPSIEKRTRILADLKDPERSGFIAAINEISTANKWIEKRSKEGKALNEAVKDSQAISQAAEIRGQMAQWRWVFFVTCFREVQNGLHASLRKARKITYDGLIGELHRALKRGTHKDALIQRLRERYKIVLVDESQDTDRRQMEIFKAIFLGSAEHRMVLIGDPKQAIYEFRGADVNVYLEAKNGAQQNAIWGLTKTYRAPTPLVEAWNALFNRSGSLLKTGLNYAPATSGLRGRRHVQGGGQNEEAPMEFWIVRDEFASNYSNDEKRLMMISGEVATEIVRLLNHGEIVSTEQGSEEGEGEGAIRKKIEPGDFAILVNTADEARTMERALKTCNVPTVRAGEDDVMASEEARDLLSIFRALENPRNKKLRFTALATRLLGHTDADLQVLSDSEDAKLEQFLRWQQVLTRFGPAGALAVIDCSEGIVASLSCGDDGERRVTNFRQLCDVLQSAFVEQGNRWGRFVRWLAGEIARAEMRSEVEERKMRLESDANAVRILTMHKAKGLEFPLVFCPFLWNMRSGQEIQKLSRGGGRPVAMVCREMSPKEAELLDQAALEERLRLAYVAITRAQVKVWIHGGAACGKPKGSALDYLLEEVFPTNLPVWREELNEKTKGIGGRHARGVETLQKRCPNIVLSSPPQVLAGTWCPTTKANHDELFIESAPTIPPSWHLTSFSALTREENRHWAEGGDEGMPEAKMSLAPASVTTMGNPFLTVAGGKTLGSAIHDWIQDWDFNAVDEESIRHHLSGYPLVKNSSGESEVPALEDAVMGMLDLLRDAVLPRFDCRVSEACPEVKASEWHFFIPLGKNATFGSEALAQIFQAYPQEGYESYPARLHQLSAEGLRGYLHGFIDRLAVKPDTNEWGVIDWKTNKLAGENYEKVALQKCAMENHYFLQVHLYLVALRRYLRSAGAAQDAWLVFLRGIAAGSEQGILHIRPPEKLLHALDNLFFQP